MNLLDIPAHKKFIAKSKEKGRPLDSFDLISLETYAVIRCYPKDIKDPQAKPFSGSLVFEYNIPDEA